VNGQILSTSSTLNEPTFTEIRRSTARSVDGARHDQEKTRP
jgi:hypothetical protein